MRAESMRLFLRAHLPLVLCALLQFVIMLSVFWLDEYQLAGTVSYAFFLGGCVFVFYLIYHYFRNRSFYQLLARSSFQLKESARMEEESLLPNRLNKLLYAQYLEYHRGLQAWERKQETHLTFINLWVHQMKTPLAVLELMLQAEKDEKSRSMLEETDRLRSGLDMVLSTARLETFAQDFHVDQLSLRELVNEVIRDNRRLFIRHEVYPEISIAEGLRVESDAKWLRFVLQQLLSNAVKYSAGSREKVTVTAHQEGRQVVLTVIDRGIGIPASDLKRVFHPFFTGENGRKYQESTGMGLYLVKEVLDKLEHAVSIDSEEGAGTVVRIVFPALQSC